MPEPSTVLILCSRSSKHGIYGLEPVCTVHVMDLSIRHYPSAMFSMGETALPKVYLRFRT